ncbi:hypothetical protein [Sporosarcina sp. ZBG7A]|nr:hypothetical protein [Sporosarcina sp. ZBG7A]
MIKSQWHPDGERYFNPCFTFFIQSKGAIGKMLGDIGNMAREISNM